MNRTLTFILAFFLLLGATPAGCFAMQSRTQTTSVEGLIFDLEHPDPERRINAARLLGHNKVKSAVPALIKASDAPEPRVRSAVLQALDQIHDLRAQPVFIRMIGDTQTDIRRNAIDALVKLYVMDDSGFIAGTKKVMKFLNPFDSNYNDLIVEPYVIIPQEAIDALANRLVDQDNKARKAAVMSLGILRGRSALSLMQNALNGEKENDIKLEYLRSFYKIGDRASCVSIAPLINDPDKGVHDEAIMMAGLLRCEQAVEPLMDIYESGVKERKKVLGIIPASGDDDLQLKCLQALSLIGDERSEKLFLPALRHANEDFAIAAATGLGRIGNKANLARLETARKSAPHKGLQYAADFGIFKLGKTENLNELAQALDSRNSDQVYNYLLELNQEELPLLFPILRSSTGKIRVRIIEILGMLGGRVELDEVRTYSNDSDADVVSAALLAIRRIESRM